MIDFELVKSPVVFDDEDGRHRYLLGGRELSGITSTLIKRAFPAKNKNIPEDVLANAARKGTEVHEAIEYHDNFGGGLENPRIASYERIKKEYGLRTIANEYLVSDELHYASKIDIVMVNQNNEICLVDTKTTYVLDKPVVALQLSIYKWLFELQNKGLKVSHIYALWLPNKDVYLGELHELTPVEEDYLKTLVEADIAGIDYAYESVPEEFDELEAQYRELSTKKDEIEKALEVVKSKMISVMKSKNVTSIKTDGYSFNYIPPSVKRSFDSVLFKKERFELYEQYMKETRGKEQIRISVRNPRTENKNQ